MVRCLLEKIMATSGDVSDSHVRSFLSFTTVVGPYGLLKLVVLSSQKVGDARVSRVSLRHDCGIRSVLASVIDNSG